MCDFTREWNFSKNIDYHSQRNNRIIPFGACGVTSDIMAMRQAGWPVEEMSPDGVQPEDYLMDFIRNGPHTRAAVDRFAPWGADLPWNQIHVIMVWAMNRLFGGEEWSTDGPVARFSTGVEPLEMLRLIAKKHGVVISGSFDLGDGRELGHIVSLAGVGLRTWNYTATLEIILEGRDEEWMLENLEYFIIDDPYGNYHTMYDDPRGNDVKMPAIEFYRTFKPVNISEKWAQVIYPHGTA